MTTKNPDSSGLEKELKELLALSERLALEALSLGKMRPYKREYTKWTVDQFKYDTNGAHAPSMSGHSLFKDDWSAAIAYILGQIQKELQFEKALEQLQAHFPEARCKFNLERLVQETSLITLNSQESSKQRRQNLLKQFMSEMNGEPQRCVAVVMLKGIALESKVVDLSPEISLKRVTREDLEKEIPLDGFSGQGRVSADPSVRLDAKMVGEHPPAFQERIEKITAELRLFGCGITSWTEYRFESDLITSPFGGCWRKPDSFRDKPVHYITRDQEDCLKTFFKKMEEEMPKNLYAFGKLPSTTISIAYNRYCDAILERHIFEEKIMYAIMGLETLFLNENQELTYKLSMRVSKFLSYLGFVPLAVRGTLRDAYAIRSSFAHGGLLKQKTKSALESTHGSLDEFGLRVMNYLRLAIVLFIFLKIGKNSKKNLLEALDNSLVDHQEDSVLQKRVSAFKPYCFTGNEKHRGSLLGDPNSP